MARARRAVERAVGELLDTGPDPANPTTRSRDGQLPLVLVACSGGPDSLALAAVAAHFARRGRWRVGAAVIDHQLQPDSAAVAERAAEQARALGLNPVSVRTVRVQRAGHGPEMAARLARYTALGRLARETGAAGVLLGHTRDDQAETVLLGLARGSGTRSLSGMPRHNAVAGVDYVRPLLGLAREDTLAICAAEDLDPWHDPTNRDTSLTRARVRHDVLPMLESHLGPGVAAALARTASVLAADAELLDELAALEYERALVPPGEREPGASLELSADTLRAAPDALRRRVLARACVAAGGETPTFERLEAIDAFVLGHGAAGPVQAAGKVAVWRRRARARYSGGTIVLIGTRGR